MFSAAASERVHLAGATGCCCRRSRRSSSPAEFALGVAQKCRLLPPPPRRPLAGRSCDRKWRIRRRTDAARPPLLTSSAPQSFAPASSGSRERFSRWRRTKSKWELNHSNGQCLIRRLSETIRRRLKSQLGPRLRSVRNGRGQLLAPRPLVNSRPPLTVRIAPNPKRCALVVVVVAAGDKDDRLSRPNPNSKVGPPLRLVSVKMATLRAPDMEMIQSSH